MVSEQYKEAFDLTLNHLVEFCSQMNKAQNEIFRTKPNTQERETTQLDLDAAKNSIRTSFTGMKSIIDTCETAWRHRNPPETDIEKFWGDFQNQVMSKYSVDALPFSCKLLKSYIDSH